MSQQNTLALDKKTHASNVAPVDGEPLGLYELLTLINLAGKRGYSVKESRDLRTSGDEIYAEVFVVWFAIENDLSVFAHNIPGLIAMVGLPRHDYLLAGNDPDFDVDNGLTVV